MPACPGFPTRRSVKIRRASLPFASLWTHLRLLEGLLGCLQLCGVDSRLLLRGSCKLPRDELMHGFHLDPPRPPKSE
jgi:hypothetical protein